MSMNWRLASRFSVITLALLVVIIVALWGVRNNIGRQSSSANPGTNSYGLQGTDLGGAPAPNFHLTDQFGKPISLSQFSGKPVVVTFLYTHCTTVCPATAEKLRLVMQDLGSDASRVAIVAISVDPKGDTPTSVLNFSKIHGMLNSWHYLIGSRNELAPVWTAYAIDAQSVTASTSTHTSALYVLDKQGREQVLLDQDFTPEQLTNDLKILLGK